MNPKKLAFDWVFWDSFFFEVLPSSTNPSEFVGMCISLFGILTTPLFWSSRKSTIFFFFLLNIMLLLRWLGIKILGLKDLYIRDCFGLYGE